MININKKKLYTKFTILKIIFFLKKYINNLFYLVKKSGLRAKYSVMNKK